jgi:hypothetical protein
MKLIKLTHNTTDKEVIVNWNNCLFVAETETNFGEKYTEVVFEKGGALSVKQTPEEIVTLLEACE